MNKRKKRVTLCPLCGGEKSPGKTTCAVETESGLVVIRGVPAMVCSQCGEEWIGASTAKTIEKLVGEARKRKTQFEVISMNRAYA